MIFHDGRAYNIQLANILGVTLRCSGSDLESASEKRICRHLDNYICSRIAQPVKSVWMRRLSASWWAALSCSCRSSNCNMCVPLLPSPPDEGSRNWTGHRAGERTGELKCEVPGGQSELLSVLTVHSRTILDSLLPMRQLFIVRSCRYSSVYSSTQPCTPRYESYDSLFGDYSCVHLQLYAY